MPARNIVIQLRPGVQQAILPDHRKMVPGNQYVVDWETWTKLSNGARQNIVQTVSVNADSTTASGSFVPAQINTTLNQNLSLYNLLTTTSTTPPTWNAAGFGFQGSDDAYANTGVGPLLNGTAINNAITGPADERYELVYSVAAITAGQVLTWFDQDNRFVTSARPAYLVREDGQGTSYIVSTIDTTTTLQGSNAAFSTVGTKQGAFAGVALATLPSGSYGWIQIEGVCPSVSVSGTVNVGDTLAVGSVAGYGITQLKTPKSVTATVVSGSALANNVFGSAMTSITGGTGNIQAYLRSLRVRQPYVRRLNRN